MKTRIEQLLGANEGTEVSVHADLCLINDGVSHSVVDLLKGCLTDEMKKKMVVMLDHDIPAGSFNTAFIQKKLIDFSGAEDIEFLQSAGISYKLLIDQELQEGNIMLYSGNHGCQIGAVGALGIDVSNEQLAAYISGEEIKITVPETSAVQITGELMEDADIYDAAMFFAKSAHYEGRMVQFMDRTAKGLQAYEKEILCLMAKQCGAFGAIFAEADTAGEIWDLQDYRPLTMLPDFKQVAETIAVKDVKVDACFIGGCAGGRIEELRKAAAILKGKRIKRELRLLIGFATNEDYLKAMDEGLIHIFFDCGAQVTNPGCAACRTTSIGVVGDGEVMVSTGCYNYPGTSGTEKSQIYLASAQTVAKAALSGVLGK